MGSAGFQEIMKAILFERHQALEEMNNFTNLNISGNQLFGSDVHSLIKLLESEADNKKK